MHATQSRMQPSGAETMRRGPKSQLRLVMCRVGHLATQPTVCLLTGSELRAGGGKQAVLKQASTPLRLFRPHSPAMGRCGSTKKLNIGLELGSTTITNGVEKPTAAGHAFIFASHTAFTSFSISPVLSLKKSKHHDGSKACMLLV